MTKVRVKYGPLHPGFGQLQNVVSDVILFVLPAVVSLAIYCKIGRTLLHRTKNASRNQVITFALFLSCICWVVLWGMAYFLRYFSFFFECQMHRLLICLTGWMDTRTLLETWKISDCQHIHFYFRKLIQFSHLFASFSAAMNAVCIIVVVKNFWKPALVSFQSVIALLEWFSAVIYIS